MVLSVSTTKTTIYNTELCIWSLCASFHELAYTANNLFAVAVCLAHGPVSVLTLIHTVLFVHYISVTSATCGINTTVINIQNSNNC